MRKFIVPLVSVLVLGILLFTSPPAHSAYNGFVELPADQKASISAVFVVVFALLFDVAIGKFPWLEFFKQYRETWALATAALFLAWFQNILPTGFEDISIKFTALLIAGVLYLLARVTLKRQGVASLV